MLFRNAKTIHKKPVANNKPNENKPNENISSKVISETEVSALTMLLQITMEVLPGAIRKKEMIGYKLERKQLIFSYLWMKHI